MTAVFHFHLRLPDRLEWDAVGVAFASLEEAYLEVCDTLPAMAGELMVAGHDLGRCRYLIAAPTGETLMEVSFAELQRTPARHASGRRAALSAAVNEHLGRARTVAAKARSVSAEARQSLVRCRAATLELRQRREERQRERGLNRD